MPITEDDVEITELSEFEPSRVDGVGKAANGFPILMLKSIDGEVTETETTLDEVLTELDKATEPTDLPDATVEDVLDEINKADTDKPVCKMCKGTKAIKGGKVKCPQCKGSGFQPMVGQSEKELLDAARKESNVAASGVDVPLPVKCPTCNGSGTMQKDGKQCVDCGGSGKDGKMPTDDALHRVDAPDGKISVGDPQGREKIDKSTDDINLYDGEDADLEKAKLKAKARNALPDSAFALPGRRYPIHDASHARAALSMLHNASPDEQKKIKAAVHRRYPEIGSDDDSKKSIEDDATKADGSIFSAANPALAAATSVGEDAPSDNSAAPGSPAWEAVDAATATAAAMKLMEASELMRAFAQREKMEIAAGEGNDIFDAYSVTGVMCGVQDAIGVMAQMAFHEGLEAAKSLDDDEVVEKAGRRLAGKTITALTGARDKANDLSDHITGVLGDDDPAKKSDNSSKSAADKFIERANKAQLEEELSNMGVDELEKVLDARDEKLVGLIAAALKANNTVDDSDDDGDAEKGKAAMDEADSVSSAKTENSKGKSRKKTVAANDDDDLEDEASQGTTDSASGTRQTSGVKSVADEDDDDDTETVAEKAEADMTPEEIEARDNRKAAKKAFREAKRAEEQAAQNAALQKAVEEATAEVRKSNAVLEARLAEVEKRAAPSDIVRTRPPEAVNKAAEKDALNLEISRYESMADDMRTSNPDYARECRDRVKVLKAKASALGS